MVVVQIPHFMKILWKSYSLYQIIPQVVMTTLFFVSKNQFCDFTFFSFFLPKFLKAMFLTKEIAKEFISPNISWMSDNFSFFNTAFSLSHFLTKFRESNFIKH